MTQNQVRRRLVTTFGLGSLVEKGVHRYGQTEYTFNNQKTRKLNLIQPALIELFNITSVGGVCTQKVKSEWYEYKRKEKEWTPQQSKQISEIIGHLQNFRDVSGIDKEVKRQLDTWTAWQKPADLPANRWKHECNLDVFFDDDSMEVSQDALYPPVRMYMIGDGKIEKENFLQFNQYVQLLSNQALPELNEKAPPDEIIVDITNGFRIQPMFLLSAVLFVQQQWERERKVDPDCHTPRVKLVYGAYQGSEKTEIWDITSLLQIQAVNQAITNTMLFGRGDTLAHTLNKVFQDKEADTLREVFEDEDAETFAKNMLQISSAVKDVFNDLRAIRTLSLCSESIPCLQKALDTYSAVPDKWKLLSKTLDELTKWAAELTFDGAQEDPVNNIHSVAGVNFISRLSKLYERFGNVPAQLAIIREGDVTGQIVNKGGTFSERSKYSPKLRDNNEIPISKIRNSVLHGQFPNHQKSSEIKYRHQMVIERMKSFQSTFEAFVSNVTPAIQKIEEPLSFFFIGTHASFVTVQSTLQDKFPKLPMKWDKRFGKLYKKFQDKSLANRINLVGNAVQSSIWEQEINTVVISSEILKNLDDVVVLIVLLRMAPFELNIYMVDDSKNELTSIEVNPTWMLTS